METGTHPWKTVSSSPAILRLPFELLCQIVEPLRPSDAACFSLSCRSLSTFDRASWKDLTLCMQRLGLTKEAFVSSTRRSLHGSKWTTVWPKHHLQERHRLLEALEEDLPGYSVCCDCQMLHRSPVPPSDSLDGSNLTLERLGCPILGDLNGISVNPIWKILPQDVQAVMERQVKGLPHGRPLCSFRRNGEWEPTQLIRENHYLYGESTWQHHVAWRKLSMEPFVVKGNLVLHQTQRICIPSGELGMGRYVRYGPSEHAFDGLRICEHRGTAEMLRKVGHSNILWCIALRGHLRDGIQVHKCCHCPTEYCYSAIEHGRNNRGQLPTFEIVVDVWQNLGRGKGMPKSIQGSFIMGYSQDYLYASYLLELTRDYRRYNIKIFSTRPSKSGLSAWERMSVLAHVRALETTWVEERWWSKTLSSFKNQLWRLGTACAVKLKAARKLTQRRTGPKDSE